MTRRSRPPGDGIDRRAATGPPPAGEVPGYEFDGPRGGRDTGKFGRIRDSGGFPRVRGTDGFDAVRDSGGFRAARDSGEFRAARDPGEFDAVRDSGGFRGIRDSGGFRAVRDGAERAGRPALLNLRYTPTIATSGPMRPVPPPAEFSEFTDPRPSGPFPRPRPQDRPRPRPGPPRRAGPRHTIGDRDSLDGQRGHGTLRRLRYAEDQPAEPGLAIQLGKGIMAAMRTRNWVTSVAIPILAAIAVGIAVAVVVGANGKSTGSAPPPLAAGFPPARPAAADFTGTAALAGRGVAAPLAQVASFGGTIVAVGEQTGTRIPRARFFVSADNGRTWQLGTVQAQKAGGDPPPGQAASLVAGGPRGWVAVGPAAVWISPNARGWLLEPRLPQLGGDRVTTLTAAGSGFLAAGTNIPGGNAAKASPVVWLSANGTTWQRLGAAQLGLAAGTGPVLGITSAAANGNVIVLAGTVAGATTGSGAWRSTDGGATWSAVTVPAGVGVSAAIAGLAPLQRGFIAVRPAEAGGIARAAVYVSADGAAWRRSATLSTADGAPLALGPVSGGSNGAVVTGHARGLDIAFLSPDGVTWTGTDPVGSTATEEISGVALTPAGQAIVVGATAGDAAEQLPVLTLIGATGGPDKIGLRALPGATIPQLAVNAIAASGATQVAAGGADGLPALWVSADGGSTWARAAGSTPAVLTRPGAEQLTAVAHGAAGWLAVGGGTSTPPRHPVVVGSADGRTWVALDGSAAFTGPGPMVTAAVTAGPSGYVIVGRQQAGGRTVAAAWQATGLTGWQRAADARPGALDGAGDRQMNAVTATPAGFTAVGSAGTRPAAWVSATGRTWSLVTLPLPGSAVRAGLAYVAASANRVAAAGTEVTAAGQRLPFAAVSADGGLTWTETTLPAPRAAAASAASAANTGGRAVTALAAAGGGFTATGTYGGPGNEDVMLWTLPAGVAPSTAWTPAAPDGSGLAGPGTHAITALTQAGSTLTGVGFTATPAGEQPTIWQSPVRS
jgi:hypothetical protein